MRNFASARLTAGQLDDIVSRLIELWGEHAPDRFLTGELVLCEAPRSPQPKAPANGQTGLHLACPAGNRFEDPIDYSFTVQKLVELGEYANDRIDHGIFESDTSDNSPDVAGSIQVEEVIFYLSRECSLPEIIEWMCEAGLRQATRREILNFGWKHPDVQRGSPLVALGCNIQIKGATYGICLRGDNTSRGVSLCNRDQQWPAYYRILGIVVPSSPV